MNNPYESSRATEMEAESPSVDLNARHTILLVATQFVVLAFGNQVAVFWGLMDSEFRTNGSLVASFLFGAAIVALFAFGLGAICGWLAPARRPISLRTVAITLMCQILPATALFLFYTSSSVRLQSVSLSGLFIAMYFIALIQGIGLTIVSMHSMRRWAIFPIGGVVCAIGGGLVGLSYYLMIISSV